jgi:hypothetical protein
VEAKRFVKQAILGDYEIKAREKRVLIGNNSFGKQIFVNLRALDDAGLFPIYPLTNFINHLNSDIAAILTFSCFFPIDFHMITAPEQQTSRKPHFSKHKFVYAAAATTKIPTFDG